MSLEVDVFNSKSCLKWLPLTVIQLLELNFKENVTLQMSVK